MKELDILLQRFVDHHKESLAEGEWPELEALLQTEDDVLWDWFQNSSIEEARPYQLLLNLICRAPR